MVEFAIKTQHFWCSSTYNYKAEPSLKLQQINISRHSTQRDVQDNNKFSHSLYELLQS